MVAKIPTVFTRTSPRISRFFSPKVMGAFISFLLLGLVISASAGQIYKWVDENGKTHFGDRTQAGTGSEQVNLRPINSVQGVNAERQDQQKRLLESYQRDREEKAKSEEENRRRAAKRDKQCERMRQTLANYERSALMFEKQGNGGKRYLDAGEKNKAINDLRAAISRECL